jgi:hypothetical protein
VTIPAHPAADIFPLLAGAPFEALVEDVRRNGLREPGKVDADGRLLDGRNRQAACELAGVPFVTVPADLNGDDPVAYVVSLNVHRRNLSAGQRAIAAAEAWDVTQSGSREEPKPKRLAAMFGVAHGYVSQARALVERDPDAAAAVKAGALPLAEAYDALRTRERELDTRAAKLERLRAAHPDLAELVDAGALAPDEALAAGRERDEQARQLRQVTTKAVADLCILGASSPDRAPHDAGNYDQGYDPTRAVTPAALRATAAYCAALADELERRAR